jgi:hypothetical protein
MSYFVGFETGPESQDDNLALMVGQRCKRALHAQTFHKPFGLVWLSTIRQKALDLRGRRRWSPPQARPPAMPTRRGRWTRRCSGRCDCRRRRGSTSSPTGRCGHHVGPDRAGSFEPLADVRPGTVVVLGLVTTKSDQLDGSAAIEARIGEAARLKPLAELALSTQCGFASVPAANPVPAEGQRAKLGLVARIADRVWPS